MTTDHQKLRRDGEAGPAPQRSSRTFLKGNGWYFMTREGVDVGPFASEELAQRGVEDYAGFSMDADKVYLEAVDVVPDESGIVVDSEVAGQAVAASGYHGEVFDRRRGDEEPASVRKARLFESGGGWYFATREGGNVGPFPTLVDAERGVAEYIGISQPAEATCCPAHETAES